MDIKKLPGRYVPKGDTESNWNKAVGFVPLKKEIIIYLPDETHRVARFKIGDGETPVQNLDFAGADMKAIEKLIDEKGKLLVDYVDNAVAVIPEIQDQIAELEGRVTIVIFDVNKQNLEWEITAFSDITGATQIDWGDGSVNLEKEHVYKNPGIYICKVYDATSIGSYFPAHSHTIREVKLGNTITSLPENAFSSTYTLNSFLLNHKISHIPAGIFNTCTNLIKIVIPNNITRIDDQAFSSCFSMANVVFDENSQLTNIGDRAFAYCSSLTEIAIPDSVTSIGEHAFRGCSGLTSIILKNPAPVDYNSENPWFDRCTSLTHIYVPYGCSKTYKANWSAMGAPQDILDKIVESDREAMMSDLEPIIIQNSAQDNRLAELEGKITYMTIVIDNDLSRTVELNVANATQIDWGDGTINNSLTHIYEANGNYVCKIYNASAFHKKAVISFSNTNNPTSVTIGNGVTAIYTDSFDGGFCGTDIEKIVIGKDVRFIGMNALVGCKKLTQIIFKNPTPIKWNGGYHWLHDYNPELEIYVPYGCAEVYKNEWTTPDEVYGSIAPQDVLDRIKESAPEPALNNIPTNLENGSVIDALQQKHSLALGSRSIALGGAITTPEAEKSFAMAASIAKNNCVFAANEYTTAEGWASATFGGQTKTSFPYMFVCGFNNENKEENILEVGWGENKYELVAERPTYEQAMTELKYYRDLGDKGYERLTPMNCPTEEDYNAVLEVFEFTGQGKNIFEVTKEGVAKAGGVELVKNTDIAGNGKLGLVAASATYGTGITSSGTLTCQMLTLEEYKKKTDACFISKGTLENVAVLKPTDTSGYNRVIGVDSSNNQMTFTLQYPNYGYDESGAPSRNGIPTISNGNIGCALPTADYHTANKKYVDGLVGDINTVLEAIMGV